MNIAVEYANHTFVLKFSALSSFEAILKMTSEKLEYNNIIKAY